jgi:hypothetical protein
MRMSMKRATARITLARGRRRSIHSDRARDDDLYVFLQVSRQSRRAIRWYVDRLLGPV